MKKKLSVTIGISVHNEEKNIKNLILSIISQKRKNYILNKILIISDGSTDNTVNEVKKINNFKIVILDKKTRKGKVSRINEIFKIAKTNLVVMMDGDTIPCNKYTIENLIYPFVKDIDVALTSGRFIPLKPRTFIQFCIINSRIAYSQARQKINHGNNRFSCGGKLIAISNKLYKKIQIPQKVTADDSYIYFSCIKNKFKFIYAKKATIWFNVPSTLKDHIKQNLRYMTQGDQIKILFPSLTQKESEIPKRILIPYLLKQFFKAPIQSLTILLINFYIKYIKKINKVNSLNGTWSISETTKEKIIYLK